MFRVVASPPSLSVFLAEPITKHYKVDVPKSSTAITFLSPPKRHPMKMKAVALSTVYTSQQFLMNDFFVRIVEEKTITGKFSTNYKDIVYFLNKVFSPPNVSIHYIIVFIFSMSCCRLVVRFLWHWRFFSMSNSSSELPELTFLSVLGWHWTPLLL